MAQGEIYPLNEALDLIKPKSRKKYAIEWANFTDLSENSFDSEMPSEKNLMDYIKHLRLEKKRASSTLICNYSMINSICKHRYGKELQCYARLSSLLKSYNTDKKKKADIFEAENIQDYVTNAPDEPYHLVRKIIIIMAYFGGLRLVELEGLKVCYFAFLIPYQNLGP